MGDSCEGLLHDDGRADIEKRLVADGCMTKFLSELSERTNSSLFPSHLVVDEESEGGGQHWTVDRLV